MRTRTFPKIPGVEIPVLGLGAMRLPVVGGDPTRVDEEAATRLVHEAVRAGVTYVDTAWPYHGGESERFLGRVLHGGLRDRVLLATKSPVWEMRSEADFERVLDAQLARLGTDHVDFYLLHALAAERWDHVQRLGGMRALARARDDGRIRHLGFSFHGPLDDFRRIADARDWELAQIQLNYLDQGFQAGLEGLRHAAARGIGVVVMEPLRGGALAAAPPAVRALLARGGRAWSPAEWALRWVLSLPGVVTVLSGMGTVAQLAENVAAAEDDAPLGPGDLARIEEARALYQARMAVPCTTCGYCQPCPSGVAIADVFNAWNTARMFEDRAPAARVYRQFQLAHGSGGDQCIECGDCAPRCPQGIAIPERLREAHADLTAG